MAYVQGARGPYSGENAGSGIRHVPTTLAGRGAGCQSAPGCTRPAGGDILGLTVVPDPSMIDLAVESVAPWPDSDLATAFIRTADGDRVFPLKLPRADSALVTPGGPATAPGSIHGVLGNFLAVAGGRILSVDFTEEGRDLEDCRVSIEREGKEFVFPIRTVDGIALALATGAPLRAPEGLVRGRFQRTRPVDQARDWGVKDERVLAAVAATSRRDFVPDLFKPFADLDRTLPIGEGQTISQPLLVARMTEMLSLGPQARVLEVGAGCGWQAAILSRIASEVHAIEIVPVLAEALAARTGRLGLSNIRVREGDGYAGWPEAAPFDAIVVSCAAPRVPEPLVDQLKRGGRMVIPVHRADGNHEDLVLLKKAADGSVSSETVLPVWFVPMTGRLGP